MKSTTQTSGEQSPSYTPARRKQARKSLLRAQSASLDVDRAACAIAQALGTIEATAPHVDLTAARAIAARIDRAQVALMAELRHLEERTR